jgi:hypothetical protein
MPELSVQERVALLAVMVDESGDRHVQMLHRELMSSRSAVRVHRGSAHAVLEMMVLRSAALSEHPADLDRLSALTVLDPARPLETTFIAGRKMDGFIVIDRQRQVLVLAWAFPTDRPMTPADAV